MTLLQVLDRHSLPTRDSTIASVRIIEGTPRIGMHLLVNGTSNRWKVIGFGTTPSMSEASEHTQVLSLKRLVGSMPLAEGQTLSECETAES
jgi:hypothetical protein